MKMNPAQRCFRCRGCGAVAGVLTHDHNDIGPAGTVFHLKPLGHLNRLRVTCRLFQDLEPAEFVSVHADEPDIEGPRDWQWAGEQVVS